MNGDSVTTGRDGDKNGQYDLIGPHTPAIGERTLREARLEFLDALEKHRRAHCPCCGCDRQVYRRKISSSHAHDLLWMYRHAYRYPADRYASWRDELQRGNILSTDFASIAYWRLIESTGEDHPRYPSRGHWRLTPKGIDFVLGRVRVPKYCFDYYGDRHLAGDPVTIWQCLGEQFDYDELLGPARAMEAEAVVLDSIRGGVD